MKQTITKQIKTTALNKLTNNMKKEEMCFYQSFHGLNKTEIIKNGNGQFGPESIRPDQLVTISLKLLLDHK